MRVVTAWPDTLLRPVCTAAVAAATDGDYSVGVDAYDDDAADGLS